MDKFPETYTNYQIENTINRKSEQTLNKQRWNRQVKKKKRKTKLTNLSTKKRPKGNDFTGKIPPNIYRRIINTNPSKTLQEKKKNTRGGNTF